MNDNLSNKTYIFIILYLLGIVYIFLNYSYSNESQSNYWTIIGALAQGFAAVGTFCVLYISQQEFSQKYTTKVKILLEECYSDPVTPSTLSEEPAIIFKYIILINNGFRPIKPILLFISYTDDRGMTKQLIANLNDLPISASDCYCHKLRITPILSSLLWKEVMNNNGKKYLKIGFKLSTGEIISKRFSSKDLYKPS